MSRAWSPDLNQSLIDKVRSGKSPTPKDRRDRSSYGFNKSGEDAKSRIQKDILESLKEGDGIPALVYPQDYIFDIAHFRANGNLGELIDDMSNIANPEEKFEMVKSENKILRERLHNALQREMKAIKTFQRLANENRLLLLRLKKYENMNRETPEFDVNTEEPYKLMNGSLSSSTRNHNGEHRKHAQITLDNARTNNMANKSTSTSDLRDNVQNKSTSTEDLSLEDRVTRRTSSVQTSNAKTQESTKMITCQLLNDELRSCSLQQRRELFKTNSSPNILEEFSGRKIMEVHGRVRSASLGCQSTTGLTSDLRKISKSFSSEAINNHSITSLTPFRKLGENRVSPFPSSLDVVNEEVDTGEYKGENPPGTERSSVSSEGNISLTHSASSDQESNSPCNTPTLESASSEKVLFPPQKSLQALHVYSRSLPAKLNGREPQNKLIPEGSLDDQTSGNDDKQIKASDAVAKSRRQTTEGIKLRKSSYSSGSLRSLSERPFKNNFEVMLSKDGDKKEVEKASSSEESDKEEKPLTLQRRRRAGYAENNPNDFVADIRKFQQMLSSGQIPRPSHESDNEEDILQACEAVRNQRYSCRRGSAVVQITASSVQMDLHVATDAPLDIGDNRKKQLGSILSLDDKRASRWSSLLKNRKKMLLQKDRLRISEDLKEFLSTKIRPTHIASETELSLYRDTHWTHLMKVTDETGNSRPLSDAHSNCLPEEEMKRREAVWELFHSEVVYLTAHLLVLKECFLEPLQEIKGKGFLINVDERKIFSNLEDLCEVSAKFAKDLLHLFKNEQENQFGSTASVVTAFTKFKWTVHSQYERYCLNYTSTLNYLETLKRMEEVQEFFKWCETDSRCNRLKLTDLLVAPFQHLTKYPLLLKNIRKRTSEGDRQHAPLSSTIKSVEVLIQELEGNVTVVRNYQKLKELQKNLVWPSVGELDPKSYIPELIKSVVSRQECSDILASPNRQLIYEGSLTVYENTKTDVLAFLFDDMLLLTKGTKKSNRHLRKISMSSGQLGGNIQENLGVTSPALSRKVTDYTYSVWKQPVPIDRFVLHDLDEYQGNSIKNGFVLVHMSRFKQAIAIHTLQASSKDVKDTWISKLRSAQNKWNEVIKQENSQEKSSDDLAKADETRKSKGAERTDSGSEQDSVTNSEHISSNDEDQVFYQDDIELQTVSPTYSNSHTDYNDNANPVSGNISKLNVKERKTSRLLSEI